MGDAKRREAERRSRRRAGEHQRKLALDIMRVMGEVTGVEVLDHPVRHVLAYQKLMALFRDSHVECGHLQTLTWYRTTVGYASRRDESRIYAVFQHVDGWVAQYTDGSLVPLVLGVERTMRESKIVCERHNARTDE